VGPVSGGFSGCWRIVRTPNNTGDGRDQHMFSRRINQGPSPSAPRPSRLGEVPSASSSATASTGSGTPDGRRRPRRQHRVQPVSARGGSNARSGARRRRISRQGHERVQVRVLGCLTSGRSEGNREGDVVDDLREGHAGGVASRGRQGKDGPGAGTTNGTDDHGHAGHRATDNERVQDALAGWFPFKPGAPSTAKTVGQVPANYKQGSGTIVSETTANKATKAALAAYPGGIVDRCVRPEQRRVRGPQHRVNWPHHVFVNQNFKVVGAN